MRVRNPHRYTAKIILRKDAIREDGKAPVSLQVFINGMRKVIALSLFVEPEYFNSSKQRIQIPDNETYSRLMTAVITKARTRAEEIFYNAMIKNIPLTRESFADEYFEDAKSGDFIQFMEREIVLEEQSGRSIGTVKNYRKCLSRLREFKEEIPFGQINYNLVKGFDRFVKKRGVEVNTVADYHKNFKKFINIAVAKGNLKHNPYKNFKIIKARTSREFLDPEELQVLIDLYRVGERALAHHQLKVLRYFLFMCFSGMRYQDVAELRLENRKKGILSLRPLKTRATRMNLTIDLNSILERLINDSLNDPQKNNNDKLFDCISLQKTNVTLKTIALTSGIEKNLTCHVGRHTFATNFLIAGGQVEVLKEMLGHSKIETTMVYTHIVDSRRKEMMKGMGEMFSF